MLCHTYPKFFCLTRGRPRENLCPEPLTRRRYAPAFAEIRFSSDRHRAGETIIQFFTFSIIGAIGTCVDLACVYLAYDIADIPFRGARVLGFVVASRPISCSTGMFTFGDKRNGGAMRQYALFFVICTLGFLVNGSFRCRCSNERLLPRAVSRRRVSRTMEPCH